MTLVNAEFYFALKAVQVPDALATAAAAAVLHRPFTPADAEMIRVVLEVAGASSEKAAATGEALLQDLR